MIDSRDNAPQYPLLSLVVSLFFAASVIAFLTLVYAVIWALFGRPDPASLFYLFQTYVTGLFVLVGAGWTVWAVLMQINHADRQFEKEQSRNSKAARLALNFTLNEIAQYAYKMAEDANLHLIKLHLHDAKRVGDTPKFGVLYKHEISLYVISSIKECILYSPLNSNASEILSRLLFHLQVCDARKEGEMVGYTWSVSRMSDAVFLYALASRLFDYTRCKSDHPDLTFSLQFLMMSSDVVVPKDTSERLKKDTIKQLRKISGDN